VRFATLAFWEVVLAGTLRLATPLLYASLGETIVERAGMLNLGIEGTMLAGALAGVWGSYIGGPLFGVILGVAVGLVLSSVMGLAVLRGSANQVVVGIAITFLGAGTAAYLFQLWVPSGRSQIVVDTAPVIRIDGLEDLALIGGLFRQSVLTYLALAMVPLMEWTLRSTRAGLAVRAVGDDPDAARVRGVDPVHHRFGALLFGGALAGLAGASITVGYLGQFSDGLTAGRGFVALAIVIIGGWTPVGALGGALLFALFDSLALQAQTGGVGLPVEAWAAMPYLVTLVVLIFTSSKRRSPRALGRPLAV
jgi:general nucleoside transport system permease protein